MDQKKYLVYMHERKKTGQKYFGITSTSATARWSNGNGYSKNQRFWQDIQEDGWQEGFIHSILHKNLSEKEALELETQYILKYQTYIPKKGYNKRIKDGCRDALSNEAKENMSLAQLKRYEKKEEHLKQSNIMKEKYTDPSFRARYQQAWENSFKTITPEQKKALTESQSCAVKCLETGKIYPSISEAARQTQCDRKGINRCVLGQALSIHGKHWVKADDNITTIEMIESHRKKTGKARSVICVETGEIFLSIGDAERKYGGDIQHCVMGLQQSAAGYHWKYYNP